MNLSFENISVHYDGLVALEGLSLEVESGESVAIIGPSGCGKSTLLRLAAGLAYPTQGIVRAGDEPITAPRREIALILQDYGLLPWKTVYRNAELGLLVRKASRVERERRTLAALEQVGLKEFASAYPAELSGGMQQRLALARALALDARVLLMDEPLSALDAFLREELQDLLLSLWQSAGQTQVVVTHSIEEAVYLGRRIVVMAPRPGRVVSEIGNPHMGSATYRASDEFFECCREVRNALAHARGQEGKSVVGSAAVPAHVSAAPDADIAIASTAGTAAAGTAPALASTADAAPATTVYAAAADDVAAAVVDPVSDSASDQEGVQ